jgi:hypothetical protein
MKQKFTPYLIGPPFCGVVLRGGRIGVLRRAIDLS